RVSTPRRKCTSTVSSNLAGASSLTSFIASEGLYSLSRSMAAMAASILLPRFMVPPRGQRAARALPHVGPDVPALLSDQTRRAWRRTILPFDSDTHRACRARDDLHRSLDIVRVEVRHLGLSDLAE